MQRLGYRVVAHNWRTRVCEIDIVAMKDDCAQFIEVKYRHGTLQGSGLDYITKGKLRQMRYAADQWAHENHWHGAMNLAAIEVCAPDFAIGDFIPAIDVD